jgi:hypothetical protein
MASDAEDVERRDIEALGATRQELGEAYEPALLESFAERVEQAIQLRVDRQVAQHQHARGTLSPHEILRFVLGVGSLVAAIPISIVALVQGQLLGLLVAWTGIVLVNVAYGMSRRPR